MIFSFDNGINEIIYTHKIAKLINMPVDEEFNSYVLKVALPVYADLAKGNYPNLKSTEFSSKLPSNYFPKSGYFWYWIINSKKKIKFVMK